MSVECVQDGGPEGAVAPCPQSLHGGWVLVHWSSGPFLPATRQIRAHMQHTLLCSGCYVMSWQSNRDMTLHLGHLCTMGSAHHTSLTHGHPESPAARYWIVPRQVLSVRRHTIFVHTTLVSFPHTTLWTLFLPCLPLTIKIVPRHRGFLYTFLLGHTTCILDKKTSRS